MSAGESGHERFEELAVGHVLGGLGSDEAATFRSHLIGCRDCRLRVAELRDIAAGLAQAEREERRLAATKLEVARRQAAEEQERGWWARAAWPVALTVSVVAALLSMALLFWNYYLRSNNAELLRVTQEQEKVLETLAGGQLLDAELAAGVRGLVAVSPSGIAIDLTGLPQAQPGEELVVWLLGTDGVVWQQSFPATRGRLPLARPVDGARWLVVSLEAKPAGERPAGRVLVRADLGSAAADPDQPSMRGS